MFFWFAGLTLVLVAWVFASPLLDYRLVMLGSVLPAVEMALGGPWVLHTLLAPVVVMTAVMLIFQGRRLVQRRWLGLPIGMFFYLILDGAWRRTTLFWWPVLGWRPSTSDRPEWEPIGVLLAMEIVGLAALGWAIYQHRLDRPERRHEFFVSGHLPRRTMSRSARKK